MNLLDLLDNIKTEAAQEVLHGLRRVLADVDPGPEYQNWRAAQQAKAPGVHWRMHNANEALRRDRVWVEVNSTELPTGLFVARFPSRSAGQADVYIRLAALNRQDACDEVDRRWPMADWWMTVDRDNENPRCATAALQG